MENGRWREKEKGETESGFSQCNSVPPLCNSVLVLIFFSYTLAAEKTQRTTGTCVTITIKLIG
jgi:hypothetical protein